MLRSNRNALIAFFSLTFVLSWGVWATGLAFQNGLLDWKLPGDPLSYLAITVAAVLITALSAGAAGLRSLFGRMIIWRVHVKWYLAALLIPGVPALVAIGIHFAAGGEHDMGALIPLSAVAPLLLTQILLHLLTEELGWRGFALPRLRTRFGPLAASLVLGPIWAAWHIPLFLLAGSRQSYPFIGFVILAISITVIMTWIFDRTRGSVLIAAIFHAAMNTWWAATNALWGAESLFWILVTLTAITAVAVAILQHKDSTTTSVRQLTGTAAAEM
ncbi:MULTISPECIES: CPBP family intramembrane glutamic endopeptidase [unclassified Diaminobutyricimonas]|uniref:CPBP family intramembrane glutamic endopeptidase n=1 Tax=unclassified Diaminobutyricimonas TaxID=2643261 RepID=UPI0012F49241|nr:MULTISPECIES: CPBP family intramembrane glutamic endopeptidase [unclassified Diaminobutyricimonas]